MVSMGNATTCCLQNHRSGNMKSAVSSSSSGSEKVGGSGIASNVGYDLEENKSKNTSRMSCASDDSCAINELLEGRMDLNITLPNSGDSVILNVERRTPMLDLLVNIATQYRFNAANYTISAGDHEFKASTPIGSLDVNQILIIPKPSKSASIKSGPSVIPFQTTFRLQVNLPRNQLMVLRVTPKASIAAIKQIICSEKSLDSAKYTLVRFAGNSEGPQVLDSNKTLAYYTLNEVTLMSNKTLTQMELQFGAPTTSQVDLSTSRTTSTSLSANKKAIHSLIISQSNPDFNTIDDKEVLNHTNAKSIKKRQAPPPPMSSFTTLPNNIVSQISGNKNENNIKNDESVIKTAVSETILEAKSVPNLSKSVVNHVRQNSGSDSSGYHESVLSSDSPESSAMGTLQKSSSITSNNINNKQVVNNKSMAKKRRAPPPPSSQHLNTENEMRDNDNNENNSDENKVSVECMSDVSLPLSISYSSASDSSGTASSINNRSLSPIVITQTNGSSTPRTSMNSTQIPLEISTNSSLSQLVVKHKDSTKESNDNSLQPESNPTSDGPGVGIVTNSEKIIENKVNEELSSNRIEESLETIRDQEVYNLDIKDDKENNERILKENETSVAINEIDSDFINSSSSINAITSKSDETESLPKEVEVNCISCALTLSVSHDNDLNGHECVEQVEERDKSNLNNYQKQGSNVMPLISPPLQFVDYFGSNSKAMVTVNAAKNRLHSNDYADDTHSYNFINKSSVRSYLDSIRRAYLHEMKGDVNSMLVLTTGVNHLNDNEKSDNHNECENDSIQTEISESELAEMSLPLPPPSPFQNSNHEEHDSSVSDSKDVIGVDVHQNDSTTSESNETNEIINDKQVFNEQIKDVLKNPHTMEESIGDTKEAKITQISSDSNKSGVESEMTTTATTPLIVSDDDKLNKEIEVTLQSLNDELDRLESKEESDYKNLNNEQLIIKEKIETNYTNNSTNNGIQTNTQEIETNNASRVSVKVKQPIGYTSEMETIKNMFENRQTPSPTPRNTSSLDRKSKVTMNREMTKVSKLPNGKTTLIVNKSETPTPPVSPQPPSLSPTPSNEDKLTAEEVRQLCRPRVKLTNFSIGSYKKDVDIFEETQRVMRSEVPTTAPVMSMNVKPSLVANKPFVVTASVKQENSVNTVNQNKSKVNITATSTTATTVSATKPSIPVIQTLITTAPKLNRIQSWSGQKSISLDQRYTKEPVKTNERYVSQIAINKESKSISPPPINELDEQLVSPNLVVQSLIAKNETQIKDKSPQDLPPNVQPVKEHTTISIKPGLESIIRSHPKQQFISELKARNEMNSASNVSQNNSKQSITIGRSQIQLKSNSSIKATIDPNEHSIQPPIPAPVPPPLPQNISSFPINSKSSKISKSNKIFHTKGWKSEKVTQNGEVPKVKHVEPPNSGVDVRDALLNEIKSFGGKNTLKKVSKNTSWKLEFNGNSVKT